MTEALFQYNSDQNETQSQMRSGAQFPGQANSQSGNSGLGLVIQNLERLLHEEKEQLKLGNFKALESVAGQKIQLYSQLNRFGAGALKQKQGTGQDSELVAKLKSIKLMLVENAQLLKRRMDAISEVADTISNAMQDADGDSTYSVWPAL